MDPQSLNRAIMSTGLWVGSVFVLNLATGASLSLFDIGKDGAIMGASALASDVGHSWAGMVPSAMSSALSTGAIYCAIQRGWNNDSSYVVNFLAASANDYLVEAVGSRLA